MKLLRYGPRGAEKPGVLDGEGALRDLSGILGDISGDVLTRLGDMKHLDVCQIPFFFLNLDALIHGGEGAFIVPILEIREGNQDKHSSSEARVQESFVLHVVPNLDNSCGIVKSAIRSEL